MSDLTKEEVKEAAKEGYKEGLKEWLDEKYTIFGKWTVRSLSAALFAALTYFTLHMAGWVKQ